MLPGNGKGAGCGSSVRYTIMSVSGRPALSRQMLVLSVLMYFVRCATYQTITTLFLSCPATAMQTTKRRRGIASHS
jgi:hypothetical protein